jgi:hypothetical protein
MKKTLNTAVIAQASPPEKFATTLSLGTQATIILRAIKKALEDYNKGQLQFSETAVLKMIITQGLKVAAKTWKIQLPENITYDDLDSNR